MPKATRFESFLREKQYLQNVSPNTLSWYRHALKWLPSENPDERGLKDMVIRMREAGLKATGCNAAIRAINCYLHWASGSECKCDAGCKHLRVSKLKEPELVMSTFTDGQVKLLIGFRPRTAFERRLHLLILLLLDSGCRISEALGVQQSDIDFDNLLITLNGKGRKQRRIPISFVLRKALFRSLDDREGPFFLTSSGRPWGRVGALRAVKLHCERLGFEAPPRTLHAIRHTWALNAVRRGVSVFHVQKQLGHTSLEMSRRYVNLSVNDLQVSHQQMTLLNL